MAESGFNIAMRNYAGVPVLDLIGKIDKPTVSAVREILDKLISAGHYNVMLNLKRAAWAGLQELTPLKNAVEALASHYGKLDVILDQTQLDLVYAGAAKPFAELLRFCTSEDQALRRIRRLPEPLTDPVRPTPAHFAGL